MKGTVPHTANRCYFECIDEAVKWVNENKLAIGTLVVVGGVVYAVSTGGTGALALVPLL